MSLACNKIDLEQDTQEWLDFRKDKIGGSDIPKILGISSYTTPYQLWKEKLGFEDSTPINPAMIKGKQIEPLSRKKVNQETDSQFFPSVIQHTELEWAIYSADGIDQSKKIIWECKYNKKEFHEMAIKGRLPDEHYAQVQWGLFVSGYETCWYTSNNNEEDITVEIHKDFEYISQTLLPAVTEFRKCLLNFDPPSIGTKDYVQIHDESFDVLAHEYKLVHAEMKKLKEKQDQIKGKLLEFTDDGNCEGAGLKIFRKGAGKIVDWKNLAQTVFEKHPELKEKFPEDNFSKDQIGYWCITVNKK